MTIEISDSTGYEAGIPIQPLFLLADSQLLFWRDGEISFLQSVRARIPRSQPKAAYVGASNDDNPDFYAIFEAAMDSIGIEDRRLVRSSLPLEDERFVDEADLVLLAGGEVEKGWRAFERTGLKERLIRRYYEGALLVGVSAGAVQLGLGGWPAGGAAEGDLISTFKLVPALIGAHDEARDWEELKAAVRKMGGHARGLGIPSGGGLIYHLDHTIEPVRFPITELSLEGERLVHNLLIPGGRELEAAEETGEAPPIVN